MVFNNFVKYYMKSIKVTDVWKKIKCGFQHAT